MFFLNVNIISGKLVQPYFRWDPLWLPPYMGYIGMCRCEGYGFQAVYSRIGYINQSVWLQNRVSFFRKLISWLNILSRLGTQLLQVRGIWGVYSSIGQQNSAELALVKVKGSRLPAAHPHPEIPKVNPPPLPRDPLYRIGK